MNILFLMHYETIGPRLQLEIKTLLTEGHEVQVVAWNNGGKEYPYNFPVTYIHHKNQDFFSQSLLKKGLLLTLGRIIGDLYPRTFKEVLASSWDVIHCCNLALLPMAVLAKWLKGGKIIFDSYEMPILKIPLRLKNQKLASLTRLGLEKMERVLVSQVDGVLTIPSVDDQERKKFTRYCQKVEVLLNVPDLEGISSGKTYSPPPTAIFCGGLNREKGLYSMLAATALVTQTHPEFRLVLIGQMYEDPLQVAETIDNLGIRNNVSIHSWVPIDKLGEYLASAWIGLWPSLPCEHYSQVTTGNSRKGFEYMKYGLPVVASSFGEMAQAVYEEQAGILVDATRPEALARAITKIIDHPELRKKMAAKGMAAIRNKYNWEKESIKMIHIYNSI
jgi:glycosyltransferase involved in cell wall biosynthesis